MPRTVEIKPSHTPSQLRRLAASSKDANQSRRLLSIAAVLDGMSRAEAAKIGGMDRQTLRDWVHRFNTHGPAGLKDNRRRGNPRRLSVAQQTDLAQIVETGPDRTVDGVVRWRRVDLQHVIEERFGVVYHERTIGKLLKALGFSHISARPPASPQAGWRGHPGVRKKLPAHARCPPCGGDAQEEDRDLVPGRGADRPEERPREAVGAARHAADPSLQTSATRAPTCSAPYVRRAAWALHWRCRSPTPTPCSGTSTRSPYTSPEARTPSCCWIGPDGTPPAISSGRRTSRRSCCRHARRSSIRSSRSGNFCAPTTSPTASVDDQHPQEHDEEAAGALSWR